MEKNSNHFSFREARSLVKDLSVPNALIYWLDFLPSILIAHGSFLLLSRLDHQTWPVLNNPIVYWATFSGLFAVSAILYMRSVMFIHELVHLPERGFVGFRFAWNALCGIPLLVPSFLYYPHIDHHRRKHYGTERDGEYLDLSHRHPAALILFVAAAIAVPIAALVRFTIMTPVAWLIPGFRVWVEQHASSMIIDIFYLRGDFGAKARQIMRIQEVLCFLWCVGLIFSWYVGRISNTTVFSGYLMAVALVIVNNVRTLGAHQWLGDGRELSFEQQLLDSVNYPYRWWFTELWGPVGTRYHALHHLFPSLPYHNLGKAHRRLMAGLPEKSIYRQTERLTLTETIIDLWLRASERKTQDNLPELEPQQTTKSAA